MRMALRKREKERRIRKRRRRERERERERERQREREREREREAQRGTDSSSDRLIVRDLILLFGKESFHISYFNSIFFLLLQSVFYLMFTFCCYFSLVYIRFDNNLKENKE